MILQVIHIFDLFNLQVKWYFWLNLINNLVKFLLVNDTNDIFASKFFLVKFDK